MPPPIKAAPSLSSALSGAAPPRHALHCRRCGGRLHRSHARSRRERILWPALGLRPFRCGACGWRGLRNPSLRRGVSLAALTRTLLIIALSAALGGVLVEKCIPQDVRPAAEE